MRRGGIGPVNQLPRRPNPTDYFPASPEMQRPTRLQYPWTASQAWDIPAAPKPGCLEAFAIQGQASPNLHDLGRVRRCDRSPAGCAGALRFPGAGLDLSILNLGSPHPLTCPR